MFVQTEFKGYDTEKMEKDFNKLVKKYLKMGNTQEKALQQAKFLIDFYKHTYRKYN